MALRRIFLPPGAWLKNSSNGALQPVMGPVKITLMNRALSSAEGGHLDITLDSDDIQICIIIFSRLSEAYEHRDA